MASCADASSTRSPASSPAEPHGPRRHRPLSSGRHADRPLRQGADAPHAGRPKERDAGAAAVGDPLLRAIRATGMPVGTPFFVDADGRSFLVAVAPIDSALMFNGHRVVVAAPLRRADGRRQPGAAAAAGDLLAGGCAGLCRRHHGAPDHPLPAPAADRQRPPPAGPRLHDAHPGPLAGHLRLSTLAGP